MQKAKRKISVMLAAVALFSCFAPMAFGEFTAEEKKQQYYEDICSYAKEDASYASFGCLYEYFRYFSGPVGLILKFTVIPPIPPSRLMGRSSGYVEQYTKCYNDTARWSDMWNSLIYCGVSTALYAYLIISHPWAP